VTYLDGDPLEAKIVKEQPDVVLLDIVMPKRNGFEALRGVRRDERIKQARVIVVSSKNQESDRIGACARARTSTWRNRSPPTSSSRS